MSIKELYEFNSKNNVKTNSNICGIYLIYNHISEKGYIGQSVNIGRRWKEHKSQLKLNKHHCPYLQNSWNKYGAKEFSIICLELLSRDGKILTEIEDRYMELYKEFLYNSTKAKLSSYGFEKKKISGEDMWSAILSKDIVFTMRTLLKENISRKEVELQFEISRHHMHDIITNDIWKGIGPDVSYLVPKRIDMRGSQAAIHKLNEDVVFQIKNSTKSSTQWAKDLSVDISVICRIRRGETWKHVPGPIFRHHSQRIKNPELINKIREMLQTKKITEISRELSIPITTIRNIKSGKFYKPKEDQCPNV